jgi:hypothetical protein
MPDGFELPNDIVLVPRTLDAINSSVGAGERSELLARLCQLQEGAEADLLRRRAEFDALYEKAASTADTAEIARLSAIVREKGRAAAELLVPGIDKLRALLASPLVLHNREGQRIYQAGLDTALKWLALYEDLARKLLQLAAERRAESGEILRARPIEGGIDHAKLTREIIARFPNILSELAK